MAKEEPARRTRNALLALGAVLAGIGLVMVAVALVGIPADDPTAAALTSGALAVIALGTVALLGAAMITGRHNR